MMTDRTLRSAITAAPGRGAPDHERVARVIVAALLTTAVFTVRPGRIGADTKADLYLDPADLLRRATRLWDGRMAFGYVPNQQWGYLFPMGPFFGLGRWLGLPTWIVQRCWLLAIVLAAFFGIARLASLLSIGSPASRVVAATSYALAPAALGHLGLSSAGVPLAMAALPWIAVPLVRGARQGEPALAAVASAAAFVASGTVNATVALSMLPFPCLFLLLRSKGQRRRSLLRWWSASIVVASVVFLAGLVLLRRYGFDFTRVTERAADTTATVNMTDVVRGTSDWLYYFTLGSPWIPAGHQLVRSVPVILATGALAAVGLAGLTRRDLPERRWLTLTFGVGVIGQSVAFRGVWAAPFVDRAQSLLDGPLTPFRNVGKLAPLVALPLALGLAHEVGRLSRPSVRRAVAALAAVGVVTGAAPLWNGSLLPAGAFTGAPGYWREAAAFLAESPMDRTLIVPSMAFAEYSWGRTFDEPLQSMGRAPFVTRAIFPAGGPLPTTRLLDVIDAALATGEPVPGLPALLARSGIRYVLLRADGDTTRSGATDPVVVAEALESTPGLRHTRAFGPEVVSARSADRLVASSSAASGALHTLEVYEVEADVAMVSALPDEPVRLVGGLESLLQPEVAALADGRPVLLDADGAGEFPDAPVVVADGLRQRDVNTGDARGALNASYVLAPGEVPAGSSRLLPIDLSDPDESRSVAADEGARALASSSFGVLSRYPDDQPSAAIDGSPGTAWVAGPVSTDGTGEWWELDFPSPVDVSGTSIRLLADLPWRPTISRARIVTDGGSRDVDLTKASDPQALLAAAGATSFLRIEVLDVEGFPGGSSQVGISEVEVPGVEPRRMLVVPTPPRGASSYVFGRVLPARFDPTRWDEEAALDRLFTVVSPESATLSLHADLVQPTGPNVIAAVLGDSAVTAEATSSWFGRVAAAAPFALDGDAATAWVADPFDPAPTLTISWEGPRVLRGIDVVAAGAPVRTPTAVVLQAPDRAPLRVELVAGSATFEPILTSSISVEIVSSVVADGTSGIVTPPATGAAEVTFRGASDRVDLGAPLALRCGDGPTVVLDDTEIRTRPTGTIADALRGAPVAMQPCGRSGAADVELATGLHRLRDGARSPWRIARTALVTDSATDLGTEVTPGRAVAVEHWSDTERRVRVAAGGDAVFTVAENANDGWHASLDGTELTPVRVDGWRQGWLLPAGRAGLVELEFRPTHTFRSALALWAGGFVMLCGAAAVVARRRHRAASPACHERSIRPAVADVIAGIALFVSGGVALLALPVLRRLRRDPTVLAVLGATTYGLAVVIAAVGSDARPGSDTGAFSGAAQFASLLAVGCVLASLGAATPDADPLSAIDSTPPGSDRVSEPSDERQLHD